METFYNSKLPIKSWVPVDKLEAGALSQAYDLSTLPYAFHHIALMPDCHQGYGMPIGGVMATNNVIVPNAVGVDIGCGVQVCKIALDADKLTKPILRGLLGEIRKLVPVGKKHHKRPISEELMPSINGFDPQTIVFQEFISGMKQLGTLGGGNHFIEVQRDKFGDVYLMIHSGSRNIGYKTAKYYAKAAFEECKKNYSNVPKDLSFFTVDSGLGQRYLKEMNFCVEFAEISRTLMMEQAVEVFNDFFGIPVIIDQIDIAHNYAAIEHHFGRDVWVHRKGATKAYPGQMGIIPGSQGSNSYIVRGLGNRDSFMSCSHGAGRTMSRTKAKANLDLEFEQALLDDIGVVHDMRNKAKLDEAPSAYKDIRQVMKCQEDLVDIEVELTPMGVIKG